VKTRFQNLPFKCNPQRYSTALDKFAAEWIAALADSAFGAFSAAAAHYTGGVHLLTFANEGEDQRSRTTAGAAAAAAVDGGVSGGDASSASSAVSAAARGLGAEAAASCLLATPLAVLRERLHGLRAALHSPADQSPFNAAVRQLAAAMSAHMLIEVALAAAFTRAAGARFAADAYAIAATLRWGRGAGDGGASRRVSRFLCAQRVCWPGSLLCESTPASSCFVLSVLLCCVVLC
jgi:hypothetical protein